ncbi:MAG TPA: hypothetical protein VH087_14235, partial [Thermoanaerobaculia bacterium]|nr:hypothetical protein [Thermoanaerobaculia bacterium]
MKFVIREEAPDRVRDRRDVLRRDDDSKFFTLYQFRSESPLCRDDRHSRRDRIKESGPDREVRLSRRPVEHDSDFPASQPRQSLPVRNPFG